MTYDWHAQVLIMDTLVSFDSFTNPATNLSGRGATLVDRAFSEDGMS